MDYYEINANLAANPPRKAQEHEEAAALYLASFAREHQRPAGGYVSTPVSLTLAQAHATLAVAMRLGEARRGGWGNA